MSVLDFCQRILYLALGSVGGVAGVAGGVEIGGQVAIGGNGRVLGLLQPMSQHDPTSRDHTPSR
jgi:hypothetical protein